ncbi:uncharacterized protein METZ01_LOCUS474073, partial [marine metagenome]
MAYRDQEDRVKMFMNDVGLALDKLRAAVTRIGRPEAETLAAQLPSPKARSQDSLDAEPAKGGVPGSPH